MYGATDLVLSKHVPHAVRVVHLHPRYPLSRARPPTAFSLERQRAGPISHRKIARKRLGRESIPSERAKGEGREGGRAGATWAARAARKARGRGGQARKGLRKIVLVGRFAD